MKNIKNILNFSVFSLIVVFLSGICGRFPTVYEAPRLQVTTSFF